MTAKRSSLRAALHEVTVRELREVGALALPAAQHVDCVLAERSYLSSSPLISLRPGHSELPGLPYPIARTASVTGATRNRRRGARMKISILGTGMVGRTLAAGTARLGHEVAVGTRDPDATLRAHGQRPDGQPSLLGLAGGAPRTSSCSLSRDAAARGELLVNASSGERVARAARRPPARTTSRARC